MRLGSLFDGSGTAPLAAAMCGIDPVWASEIEPFPIRVTSKRFPAMKHLGSITEINGADVVPVDIICGGSPCQDLSVAGKQAGLHDGKRSHLFFEMTRIIREMRGATNGKYPRYVVWENVPGAFSSNGGRDFLAVLQAFAEIADPAVHVPEPETRGGRLAWKNAGEMVGDGWSIAWRTQDAQYWGVPQRRRRIYLVADLGSERAGEILFERTGMSGHSEPSSAAREEAPGTAGRSTAGSCGVVYALQGNGIDRADTAGCNGAGWREGECYTLNTVDRPAVVYPTVARCLTAEHDASSCVDRGQNIAVYDARGNGDGNLCCTLTGDHQNRVTDYTALCVGNGQMQNISMASASNTLDCMHDQQAVLCKGKPHRRYIVRRLTPLECCRLQGFPDWWVEGCEDHPLTGWWAQNTGWLKWIDPHGAVRTGDSAQYKLWGNGMALPNMLHVMRGIAAQEVSI